jgi:hypothetical protein
MLVCHERFASAAGRRVPDLLDALLVAVCVLIELVSLPAALAIGGQLPPSWHARVLLGAVWVLSVAEPHRLYLAREARRWRRTQAVQDELVCQFAIGRGAGLVKLSREEWSVIPRVQPARDLRVLALPWSLVWEPEVCLSPGGQLSLFVPELPYDVPLLRDRQSWATLGPA